MKNLFKLFVPVAAAAIALVSCQPKEEQIGNNPAGEVTIRVHASAQAIAGEDTKTYIATYQGTANTILWGTDEYMKLALTAGENTTFATSTDASADTFNGDPEAMFEFSVTPETASEYVYQGLYPASAAATSNNTNAANYKVNLPAIQNATASSYDPAAYIMVAKPETFTSVQTDWEASYRRGTALNKITLKNVPDDVSFNKVKITAEGKKLAGGRHINLTTGESLEVYGTDATIEVLYATPLTGTNVDVWFTSWDTEIAEGEKLTIVAYTTDGKTYTKEITARTGGIKFQEGYLNTLGASLSGITPENVASLDGDYVILAKHNTSYYALKGEASTTRIASVDYTGSTTSFNGDASLVWTIETSGDGYTIKNGSNFIGWTSGSGNAADLVDENDYDATKCLMVIEKDGDVYHIKVSADQSRVLAKNTGSAYFAFYASTGQYSDIVLVPATALETVATPTFSPVAGEVASGTEVTISTATSGATIYYTTDGTDPTTSSTQGTSVTITATTTIKAIAVKSGMANSEIASATYSIAGAGSEWELVSDFSAIADGGEYIFVNVQNSTSYYMNTATCNQGAGTGCVALTKLPTESGFVASDNMILVLSGSADSFVASNKEGKQLKIGATNNGLAMNADSGTSLSFYTDADVSGYTLKGNDTNDVTRYIGMNSTTNFRCYNSVNNNVKTGEYVWYHHIGTGSSVTWNLESISITTPPTTTTYTAGQSFNPAGMVVTGHFVDADDNTNTKDEEVTSYTITPDGALAVTDTQVTITYQGKTATQNITVNAPSYDFETVAELNTLAGALAHNETAAYSGKLTSAVISYVPDSGNAIIKDASGSILVYKSSHGYQQGQTFSGELDVTVKMYYTTIEITAINASFTGSQAEVLPAVMTLAELEGNFSTYQNAYVKVENLTVDSRDGKNITVSNGGKTYLVYDNAGTSPAAAGDVITAVGTIGDHSGTNQIKVWASSNITITASAPKAITFTQPSAGGSFTVSVGGSNITSGTTVAASTTVTLAATPASGYNFSGWNVTGASVADASSASTSFEMGSSPVSISATFTEIGSTKHYYVKVTSTADITDGDYLIVYETNSVAFDGGLSTLDAAQNTVSVSIDSNNRIEATSAMNAAKFTIAVSAGTILSASGYYIGVTSYGNGLKQNANASTYGAHTFSIDSNGNAIITLSNSSWSGDMILNYNSNSGDLRFRYYKNGSQKKIQLYKYN